MMKKLLCLCLLLAINLSAQPVKPPIEVKPLDSSISMVTNVVGGSRVVSIGSNGGPTNGVSAAQATNIVASLITATNPVRQVQLTSAFQSNAYPFLVFFGDSTGAWSGTPGEVNGWVFQIATNLLLGHQGILNLAKPSVTLSNAVVNYGSTTNFVNNYRPFKTAVTNQGIAVIELGLNDITEGRTFAQMTNNFGTFWGLLRTDGLKLCQGSVLFRTNWTAGQNLIWTNINSWLSTNASVDYFTNHFVTGTDDGTHPNAAGSGTIASNFVGVLAPVVSKKIMPGFRAQEIWLDGSDSTINAGGFSLRTTGSALFYRGQGTFFDAAGSFGNGIYAHQDGTKNLAIELFTQDVMTLNVGVITNLLPTVIESDNFALNIKPRTAANAYAAFMNSAGTIKGAVGYVVSGDKVIIGNTFGVMLQGNAASFNQMDFLMFSNFFAGQLYLTNLTGSGDFVAADSIGKLVRTNALAGGVATAFTNGVLASVTTNQGAMWNTGRQMVGNILYGTNSTMLLNMLTSTNIGVSTSFPSNTWITVEVNNTASFALSVSNGVPMNGTNIPPSTMTPVGFYLGSGILFYYINGSTNTFPSEFTIVPGTAFGAVKSTNAQGNILLTITSQTNNVAVVQTNGLSGASLSPAGLLSISFQTNHIAVVATNGQPGGSISPAGLISLSIQTNGISVVETNGQSGGTVASDGTINISVRTNVAGGGSAAAITNGQASSMTFTNNGVYMPVSSLTTSNIDWQVADIFTNKIAIGTAAVGCLFSNVTANRSIIVAFVNVTNDASLSWPATVVWYGDPVLFASSNSTTFVGFNTIDGKTNGFLIAGGRASSNFTAYAAGTVYSLTATPALLDFGTTDPTITINTAGVYLIQANVGLKYNGATFGGTQTATLKLRKTSGTPSDITSGSRTLTLGIVTGLTGSIETTQVPPVIFTAAAGDIIQVFGSLSATPSAGTVDTDSAEIIAVRLK